MTQKMCPQGHENNLAANYCRRCRHHFTSHLALAAISMAPVLVAAQKKEESVPKWLWVIPVSIFIGALLGSCLGPIGG